MRFFNSPERRERKRRGLEGELRWMQRQTETIRFHQANAADPHAHHMHKPIVVKRSNLRRGKLVFKTVDEAEQHLYDLRDAIGKLDRNRHSHAA